MAVAAAVAAAVALCLAAPRTARAQLDSLRFPGDEGIHRAAAFEMWSGFAHVRSDRGVNYSVLAFFFTGKVMGIGLSGVYGAVLDTETGTFIDDRDLVKPLFGSSKHTVGRLDERYDRSALNRDSLRASYDIRIETSRLRFQLSMSATRDPVDLGRIAVGEGRTQRSYVAPRVDVAGRLRSRNGTLVPVSGNGLFQHAWGDSPDRSAAQDIIAIHLDDGTDIFAISGSAPDSAIVMMATDGGGRVLRAGFRLEADTVVTVGRVSFRRKWRLQTASPRLALSIDPSSEARQVSLLGIPYLIVRCEVRGGGASGGPASGVAYMYVRGR